MAGLFDDSDAAAPPAPSGPGLFGDQELPIAPPQSAPYRVLARKYRPSRFADLIGQEAMVRILRNAFALNRIAHAFMLTGVRGVGKTTTARIIARALNCIGPDGTGGPTADPCGVCPNCTAILADRHPDVMEMDAASRTGVDDVREIIEATRFRPLQARTKVFVVDEVHMLSRNAFNALLKTLEEPPPHVTFIFATTELRKVPITVLSRCQRFDLRRVRTAELAAHFNRIAAAESVPIAPAAIDLIARAADGSVRDGLSLLDQAIALGPADEGEPVGAETVADMLGLADRGAVFDLLEAAMAGRPAAALAITERMHERGADLGLLLQDLLELTHTLSRLKSVPELRDSAELPETERVRGAALADLLSIPQLGRAWQMLLKGITEVEQAPDRRAAAEMILIRLCHVADLPTPGDLVRRLGASGAPPPPASGNGGGPGGGLSGGLGGGARAVAGGAVQAMASAQTAPRLAGFPDIVALASARGEKLLHAHLLHSVHLVRFAPPVIELNPDANAPRDLSARLAALLLEATGTRWTIAVSALPGAPTLAAQGAEMESARREVLSAHPMVQAILAAFPGARLEFESETPATSNGEATPAAAAVVEDDVEGPGFAPPDADFIDDPEMEQDL